MWWYLCDARKNKEMDTHNPEYESVLALGGLCMNEDTESLFELNEILNGLEWIPSLLGNGCFCDWSAMKRHSYQGNTGGNRFKLGKY
jgi:hypothetical protein